MRQARPAYTLLEVLLALSIAVMLLAAVYSVIGYQLRQAQAGRDLVEQTTLARSLLDRISEDVTSALTLADAARFRRTTSSQSDMSSSSGSAGAAAGGTTTTPMTGTTAPSTTGMGTSGAGATASAASTTNSSTSSPSTTTTGGVNAPVELPLGVIGSASELHLFASKFPNEVFGDKPGESGQLTSDLRRISYWLDSDGDSGLCRMEARLITSEDATSTQLPTGDTGKYLLAPEVKSLEIQYFDGTTWVESWDSTELGQDNKTPKGSPRLIAIKIGIVPPSRKNAGAEGELKYYRHVVFIPTAGGTPLEATEGGATAP